MLIITGQSVDGFKFQVLSHSYLQKASVYASATAQKIDGVVSLQFVSSDESPQGVFAFIKPMRDPDPSDLYIDTHFAPILPIGENPKDVHRSLMLQEFNHAKEVHVVITLPAETRDQGENTKWMGLAVAVGYLCQRAFPNMDPSKSSLVVKRGVEHLRLDSAFGTLENNCLTI